MAGFERTVASDDHSDYLVEPVPDYTSFYRLRVYRSSVSTFLLTDPAE